jgi:hypothetical protein
MPKKRTPARRKATGNHRMFSRFLRAGCEWITGWIPVLVAGPERALTWAGEPLTMIV